MDNLTQPKEDIKTLIITGLVITLVMLLGGVGYIYKTKDVLPKNTQAKSSITSENITFEDLPPSIQNQYISRTTYMNDLSQIEKEKELLAKDLEEIIVDSKQQELLQKTAVMQKDTDQMIIEESGSSSSQNSSVTDPKNFKTYTCKTFQKGSITVPKSCKKGLYKFLDKYKQKAKEFEVIGMVDYTEFKLIRNLEDVYGTDEVKEVKKYVQIGLSRQRVIESTWLAKQYLPKNKQIGAVNYTVYSDDKRGFVIRAYF